MVPQEVPLQPLPFTLHVTAVFVVFAMLAMYCCCAPVTTCAEVGDNVTWSAASIVTDALADFVGSATEVAITDTTAGLGGEDGAV